MDAQACLKKLEYVGVLAFATTGLDGSPQVRNISAIHYEPNAMYFFTARGKDFCRELNNDNRVQVLGYTKYKEMIRLSAIAEPVPADEQSNWIDVIFNEQPYLKNVYPGETRKIGVVFCMRNMMIEYFNLGVNPIFRETYKIGEAEISPKGYHITDACIACGKCLKVCPQNCIEKGRPFKIAKEHCLHCGACFEVCPADAIDNYKN